MPTVVVAHDLPIEEAIRGRRDELSVMDPTELDDTISALRDAEMLICNPVRWDDRLLEALEPGDWVQVMRAGYDAYPVDAFRDRGIKFSNAAGIHDSVVAEHAFALALSFTRNIPEFSKRRYERTWGPRSGLSLKLGDWKNKRLTVYGVGNIGESIARRGLAFEMDVYGIKRNPDDYNGCLPDGHVLPASDLRSVLPKTDLLAVIVPLTAETRGSIDAAAFEALPDSAVLVNVARGPVVDQDALVDALRDDSIAGAGLDVFETEPLPEESPLWGHEDVLITPHVGGRSDTFPKRFGDLFLENYDRLRADEPLINQVI
jgi:D-2-hydroxyacid dehydrogenase (NADP+)